MVFDLQNQSSAKLFKWLRWSNNNLAYSEKTSGGEKEQGQQKQSWHLDQLKSNDQKPKQLKTQKGCKWKVQSKVTY